jgi:hypothetical protein
MKGPGHYKPPHLAAPGVPLKRMAGTVNILGPAVHLSKIESPIPKGESFMKKYSRPEDKAAGLGNILPNYVTRDYNDARQSEERSEGEK